MFESVWIELAIIGVVISLLLAKWRQYQSKHAFNVRISKKHLKKLQTLPCPKRQMGFIRAVNPYIFEEMILTSFERMGHRIKRGTRYSGDGGIDGQVKISGVRCYIQAKRYKGHILAKDIESFSELCKTNKVKGLFVHSGRTGKLSYQLKAPHIDIVSGERLLQLCKQEVFTPRFTK